jgi:hypothetical protein
MNTITTITPDDFDRSRRGDAAASQRLHRELKRRQETQPGLTLHALEAEARAQHVQTPPVTPGVTLRDIVNSATDTEASRRVFAEVQRRRKADPSFTVATLQRELAKEQAQPEEPTGLAADLQNSATNVEASQRVMAALTERRRANPRYTPADLARDLAAEAKHMTSAVVQQPTVAAVSTRPELVTTPPPNKHASSRTDTTATMTPQARANAVRAFMQDVLTGKRAADAATEAQLFALMGSVCGGYRRTARMFIEAAATPSERAGLKDGAWMNLVVRAVESQPHRGDSCSCGGGGIPPMAA